MNPSLRRTPVRRKRSRPRRGRVIDRAYLRFIAAQPCLVCRLDSVHQETRTEVAHLGERGLSQKCSDRETGPLCSGHHRLYVDSHHRLGKRFWEYHGLERDVEIRRLNELYEEAYGVTVGQ